MTMPKFDPVAFYIHRISVVTTKADFAAYASASGLPVTDLHTADQLTEAYEAGKQDQAAELAEARAEIERLEKLSVTQVMIDIVPGYEGSGLEIYAKSVADVERLIGDLGEKAEDFVLMTKPLQKQLAAEQAKNVGLREALENHPGNYKLSKDECAKINALLDAPSDDSALEAIVRKAGEVMHEKCIMEFLSRTSWYAEKGMRALPAVTLEDLK